MRHAVDKPKAMLYGLAEQLLHIIARRGLCRSDVRHRFTVVTIERKRHFHFLPIPGSNRKGVPARLGAHVLGTNGAEVTALLGNMPGGLQLLPTKNYKDSKGRNDWLRYRWSGVYSATLRQNEFISLPKQNPYTEIYREANPNAPGYMVNRHLLNPSASSEVEMNEEWNDYIMKVNEVELFHDQLGHYKHPNTYTFYGTKSGPTTETVEFECSAEVVDLSKYNERPKPWADYEREGYERKFTHLYKTADGKDSLLHVHARLQMPSGEGDTTVPSTSGMGLGPLPNKGGFEKTLVGRAGVTHEPAYKDEITQDHLFHVICDIVMKYMKEVVPRYKDSAMRGNLPHPRTIKPRRRPADLTRGRCGYVDAIPRETQEKKDIAEQDR